MKTGTQTDTYTPVFTATLCTIARREKQSKYLSTDEWINYIYIIYIYILYIYIYTHNQILFNYKRDKILVHATT